MKIRFSKCIIFLLSSFSEEEMTKTFVTEIKKRKTKREHTTLK